MVNEKGLEAQVARRRPRTSAKPNKSIKNKKTTNSNDFITSFQKSDYYLRKINFNYCGFMKT